MEIYLIRHTTPEVDKGVCYGQADVDVKPSFLDEISRLKQHVPNGKFATYSSPLQRCVKMANHFEVPYVKDERLKEMSFGDWELKAWDDINREVMYMWMNDFVNNRPPGGESFNDVKTRVLEFWSELLEKENDNPIIICTHGGVIRVLVCDLLSIPLEKAFQFHLDYGSITKIANSNHGHRIEYINR